MNFYWNGKHVRCDMVHRYQFIVVEDVDRIQSFHKTRTAAEDVANGIRANIDKDIRRFEAALDLDEVARTREPCGFIREIWQEYKCQSEIAAAIRRLKRRRESVRVETLEVKD